MEKYSRIEIEIEKLEKPDWIYEKLGIKYFEQDAIDAKYFEYYDLPVITKDNTPLSHLEAIEAARVNGLKNMPVIVANDIDANDVLRFICNHVRVKKLKPSQRFEFAMLLREHLTKNEKGIKWAAELPGNINMKIARIIGYDDKTVQEWQRVGKKALECFETGKPPGDEDDADEKKSKKKPVEGDKLIDELNLGDFDFKLDKYQINYKGKNLHLNCSEKKDTNSITCIFKDDEHKGSVTIIIKNPSSF
jgi:hypothetical protein